jgi:hypothetical protein
LSLKINVVLYIVYVYIHNIPIIDIVETSGLSSATVVDWTSYTRQLLGDYVTMESVVIGWPGIVVEIDETKMGKRKYNSEHRVEGVWVIVGDERTPKEKYFWLKLKIETEKQ